MKKYSCLLSVFISHTHTMPAHSSVAITCTLEKPRWTSIILSLCSYPRDHQTPNWYDLAQHRARYRLHCTREAERRKNNAVTKWTLANFFRSKENKSCSGGGGGSSTGASPIRNRGEERVIPWPVPQSTVDFTEQRAHASSSELEPYCQLWSGNISDN